MQSHLPVLLDEAIEGLAIQPDGFYIDGTFGRGGHARAILEKLGPHGRLLAIDKDTAALDAGRKIFSDESRIYFQQGSYAELDRFAAMFFDKKVNGVLLDCGVSSPQLDDPERGFSFREDGPLDMRMDQTNTQTAADWINTAREEEIRHVLWEYGEERFARRIAYAITTARGEQTLLRTHQLAEIVAKAIPRHEKHKHPATRTFQAIRIFINKELEDLEKGLKASLEALAPQGRLAVISFHSLEDRCVKQFLQLHAKGHEALRKLPLSDEQLGIRVRLIGKAIKPTEMELAQNIRARSAVLRLGEKL